MAQDTKVLIIEDTPRDAELVLHELRRAGLNVESRRVYAESDLRRELADFQPQIVLSDFKMPRFTGLQALSICRQVDPDVPFIFVSGTMGEDVAVQAMKAGAVDYVMKTNLTRLGPAVVRELREAEVRKNQRLAESGLRRAQLMAKLGHIVTAADGAFERWSETLPQLIGVENFRMPTDMQAWIQSLHPADRARFQSEVRAATEKQGRSCVEYRLLRDGRRGAIYIRHAMEPLEQWSEAPGKRRWFHTLQDVTDQTLAEEKIKRLNRVYAVLSGISSAIIRINDRTPLFREACRICVEQGQFRGAWIGTVEHHSGRVRADSAAGDVAIGVDHVPFARMDTDRGVPNVAILATTQKHPIVSNRISDNGHWLTEQCSAKGVNSIAVFALSVRNEPVAVMVLYAAEADFFDDEELRLLNALADDISFALDHIEQQKELRSTEQALRAALRSRDEFLSIISHELTTPLASLRYQMQVFLRHRDKGDIRIYTPSWISSFVDQANRQAERLTRLVHDMLDVARIRTGRLAIHKELVSLNAIVKDVVAHLQPALRRAETPVEIVECPGVDGYWDRLRLEQVVTNLLTNAMRYGGKKPVTVSVSRADDNVRLAVRDQGIGIAKDAQRKIFDRFERSVSADEVSGLGLGLYITKQIVEAHAGRIWVESDGLNKGSTFFVELPTRM